MNDRMIWRPGDLVIHGRGMVTKRVYLDGEPTDAYACTQAGAAKVVGLSMQAGNINWHVSEGPAAFYVTTEPSEEGK